MSLSNKYRTHTCGDLNADSVGKVVTLSGWVHRRRDHGGVIFVDLRDRYGLTQTVSDPVNFSKAHEILDSVRSEYVVTVTGTVRLRPTGNENTDMSTGEIEVLVNTINVLNKSLTPPFEIDQNKEVGEEIRLKYRYLDLRRDRMRDNIILRHKIINFLRSGLDDLDFLEVETPILIKGTPEGSREFLVPSRLQPNNFYVLPQSPQQMKQMLMVAGFDKYFQVARCFRDEDQRGDRQPEFTQLDMEMSFVNRDDVMAITESLLKKLTKKFAPGKKMLFNDFPVLTYDEAMNLYGSDKPDLRFDMPMKDITDIVDGCGFSVFASVVKNGGVVKALRVEGGGKFTRKDIDELTKLASIYGAKGLAYIILDNGELRSPIVKFFENGEVDKIIERCGAVDGDIIFFGADDFNTVCDALGNVRLAAAKKLNIIDKNLFAYCWVVDFPMFEKDKETGRLNAVHHPFTAPVDLKKFFNDPASSISDAYDIVLNGSEIGGGSIRIHDPELQSKIFNVLEITPEDAELRFGHILKAFKYGAPPHAGIAWGLDRLVMLFSDEPNIREVIAFPKDQKARDLMLGAPSRMPTEQLDELYLKMVDVDLDAEDDED